MKKSKPMGKMVLDIAGIYCTNPTTLPNPIYIGFRVVG